jgi:hypothetical protein
MNLITNKQFSDERKKMSNYRQSAIMPRKIAENILGLNAKTIAKLQVVDEKDNEIDKELIKPLVRGLRCNPQSYDFIVNLIQGIRESGDMKKRVKRMIVVDDYPNCKVFLEDFSIFSGYFSCKVISEDLEAFLKHCNGRTIRQIVKRQLLRNLNSEFIISETEKKIIKFRPYYMYAQTIDKESGKWTAEIMLAESIFGGLITEDHGPKGFTYIPRYLFPKITCTDKCHLGSYNHVYRAIVYANIKNTNYTKGVKSIKVDLLNFLEIVFPEHLNRNNSLKIGLDKCEESLNKALETLDKGVIKENLLLNHLSFDKDGNGMRRQATLHYRLPRSA